jgi:hypothetical protein
VGGKPPTPPFFSLSFFFFSGALECAGSE